MLQHYLKGGANAMRALVTLEKYERNIDDVCLKRRYRQIILHWSKNDFKSKKTINGDYSGLSNNSDSDYKNGLNRKLRHSESCNVQYSNHPNTGHPNTGFI